MRFTRLVSSHDILTSILILFEQFIITISEAQTYTGIAILISGAIVLFNAALSEYHWEMVVLLAWSCHVTNVMAMTSFRSHLLNRPRKRHWMLFFMTCLVVMLVMATLPMGFWFGSMYDNTRPVHYAICAITPERIQEVGQAISHIDTFYSDSEELNTLLSMIIPLFIICVTFCTRAVKLSPRLSLILSRIGVTCKASLISLLRRFDDMVANSRPTVLQKYLVHGIEPSMLALLLSAELHWDFLTSMLSEVSLKFQIAANIVTNSSKLVFSLSSIGWVTRRADNIRYHQWIYGPQNQWTFGQILPISLLIYPLVSLAEKIFPLFVRTYIAG